MLSRSELPVLSCLDPSTTPSPARAIVILLTHAVNRPIKPTKPSGGGVDGRSAGHPAIYSRW